MKKSILRIITVATICLFTFSSCEKEKEEEPTTATPAVVELTKTEMLRTAKGWRLTEAISTPAYNLNAGGFANDLFNGYLYSCETDDIILFKADGHEYLNPGTQLCDDQDSQESNLGAYTLEEENMTLQMQIPFFYDSEVESVKIVELTKDVLKINYTFTEEAPEAKAPGTYTFTLTYTSVK